MKISKICDITAAIQEEIDEYDKDKDVEIKVKTELKKENKFREHIRNELLLGY